MSALNHPVNEEAIPEGVDGPIQSGPMSEKLIRRERLIAVLDARDVIPGKRSRYLFELGVLSEKSKPITLAYWSTLLKDQTKSFGDKTARKLEKKLKLAAYSLEEDGLPHDAAMIAAAFNALPVTSPEELDMRERIYRSIMAMLQARSATSSTEP